MLITVADLGGLSGPAIHVLNLAKQLAQMDLRLTLVSPQPSAALPVALEPQVSHRLVSQRRGGGLPAITLLPSLISCLKAIESPEAVYLRASVGTWPIIPYVRRLWRVPVSVEYNSWFGADLTAMGRSQALTLSVLSRTV
jgi:hypothetical protein